MKLQNTKHQLLTLFIALIFTIALHTGKAQAQVVGQLVADIPFQFTVADTQLPAGKYYIHFLNDTNLSLMEISAADESTNTLFYVVPAEANSEPDKTELNFNKYGDRYFLASLFEEGNPDGSQVTQSREEKKIDKAAKEGQEHVAAMRQGPAGN